KSARNGGIFCAKSSPYMHALWVLITNLMLKNASSSNILFTGNRLNSMPVENVYFRSNVFLVSGIHVRSILWRCFEITANESISEIPAIALPLETVPRIYILCTALLKCTRYAFLISSTASFHGEVILSAFD